MQLINWNKGHESKFHKRSTDMKISSRSLAIREIKTTAQGFSSPAHPASEQRSTI